MDKANDDRMVILEQRIEQLEALLVKEVARLDKAQKQADEGFTAYAGSQLDHHGQTFTFLRETDRLARAAFYKTHPEVLRDMIRAEEIAGKPKDDGSDPQP